MLKPLLILCVFFVCIIQAKSQGGVEVKLVHKLGNKPFSGRRSFGVFLKNKNGFEVDSNRYSIWGIWQFSFDRLQSSFNEFLAGNSKDSSHIKGFDLADSNILALVKPNFDNSVNVFVGRTSQNEFVIIPDINNNKSFKDEIIYKYRSDKAPEDSTNILVDNLPVIKWKIPAWNKNGIDTLNFFVRFIPKQFFGNLKIKFGRPEADTLLICAEPQNHWEGDFKVTNKLYTMYLQNTTSDARFIDKSEIKIYVTEKKNKNKIEISDDYLIYKGDDSIPVSKYLYHMEKIDPKGRTLKLHYDGKNRGVGISNGFYAKNIISNDIINQKSISIQNLKGRYVLLDFWGTWCIPCREILPGVKRIDSLYGRSTVQVVSIAYDNDINLVKKFVKQENMNWINLFQPTTPAIKNQNIVVDYKITTYPTSILIDPKGKIIYRGEGILGFNALNQIIKAVF